jgi:hypothetical protein
MAAFFIYLNKIDFMKAIYLAASLMFFSLAAVSQSKLSDLSFFPERKNTNAFLYRGFKKQNPLVNYQSIISGIKKLPLDNMPCLVTDISLTAPIPTLKFVTEGQTIPNPYFNSNRFSTLTEKK